MEEIHTISHKELAAAYFPTISTNNASRRLKQWILEDPTLVQLLESCGWTPGKRIFTPLQVKYIFDAFGEP